MSAELQLSEFSARDLIVRVQQTTDAEMLKSVHDRMKAARELARLHGETQQRLNELFRLDCETLRRIGQLRCEKVLPGTHRNCASWLAGLDEKRFNEFVEEHQQMVSPLAAYQRMNRERGVRKAYEEGAELLLGDTEPIDEEYSSARRFDNVRILDLIDQACAASGSNARFTIGEIAERMIDSTPDFWYLANHAKDIAHDSPFRAGVEEVVRYAVRKAPVIAIPGHSVPRFVTCYSEKSSFIRVPFELATLPQLRQMVELRRRQLEQDRAALDELESLLGLAEETCSDADLLGVLLETESGAAA